EFGRRNKAAFVFTGLVLTFILLLGGAVGWAMRDRTARHAALNQQMTLALDETSAARERALTLTGNSYQWQAALAAALSDLKRAEGLAAHEQSAVPAELRDRLKDLQDTLSADFNDYRFVARVEEIRLDQSELNARAENFKSTETLPQIKDAFQVYYGIEIGTTPAEQVSTFILG